MKKIIKSTVLLLTIVVALTSCEQNKNAQNTTEMNENKTESRLNKNEVSSYTICNANGELLITETILIEAFNAFSENNSKTIGFSYSEERNEHSLLFFLNNGGVIGYSLQQEGEAYSLEIGANSQIHSCEGALCNSCGISSAWMTSVKCNCQQDDCLDCKCNHAVTETSGGNLNLPSADDLNHSIGKRL